MYERIVLEQENGKPFKVYGSLQVNFYKAANPDEVTDPASNVNTEQATILSDTDVQEAVELFYSNLLHQIDEYERSGSGWILQNLIYLDLNILEFNPLRDSSYAEMPKKFTKGYVNIVNEDNKYFVWTVLAHLHPATEHKDRVSKSASYMNEMNMDGIEYPMQIKDINKFEMQTPSIGESIRFE